MRFRYLIAPFIWAAVAVGCSTATRLSIKPEESHQRFVVNHSLPRRDAFNKVEVALAEAYNDLPQVLKLKQPESGTFVLKPLVFYKAGGAIGADQHAPYNLKIIVSESDVSLDFELLPELRNGTWASETEIPKIHESFRSVAESVKRALMGRIQ